MHHTPVQISLTLTQSQDDYPARDVSSRFRASLACARGEKEDEMRLSVTDIDSFNQSGALVVKGVFGGEELRRLSDATDALIEEALQGRGRDHGRRVKDDPSTYFRTEGLMDRDPVFAAAAVNPDLLRAVGQCLGRPFLLINDRMVVKHAFTGVSVQWHQDRPYRGETARADTFPMPNFTAGIYLDKTTEENGCMFTLPGRHLCGHVSWPGMTDEDLFAHAEARPIIAEPGDVSFHQLSVPHGSRANKSPRKRRLLLYHYVCREVYEDAYAGWLDKVGGFSSERTASLRALISVRETLGFPSDLADLHFGEKGIEYVGPVRQDYDAWLRLLAEQESAKQISLKTVTK